MTCFPAKLRIRLPRQSKSSKQGFLDTTGHAGIQESSCRTVPARYLGRTLHILKNLKLLPKRPGCLKQATLEHILVVGLLLASRPRRVLVPAVGGRICLANLLLQLRQRLDPAQSLRVSGSGCPVKSQAVSQSPFCQTVCNLALSFWTNWAAAIVLANSDDGAVMKAMGQT